MPAPPTLDESLPIAPVVGVYGANYPFAAAALERQAGAKPEQLREVVAVWLAGRKAAVKTGPAIRVLDTATDDLLARLVAILEEA